jgi:hypothetical protein
LIMANGTLNTNCDPTKGKHVIKIAVLNSKKTRKTGVGENGNSTCKTTIRNVVL